MSTRPALVARLEKIIVDEKNFLLLAQTWRSLRYHRKQLRDMASKYPLIIEFPDIRVVLERSCEVDVLTADLRAKLKKAWLGK